VFLPWLMFLCSMTEMTEEEIIAIKRFIHKSQTFSKRSDGINPILPISDPDEIYEKS